VGNNPVNFNDPSGHKACGDGEDIQCDGTKGDRGIIGAANPKVLEDNNLPLEAYDGPCISIVCLSPSPQTPELDLTIPVPDFSPTTSSSDELRYENIPIGYEFKNRKYFDFHRVDWINVTLDVANIVTSIAILACPVSIIACGIAGAGEVVSIAGAVYSFASAENSGEFGEAAALTILDQSELIRAIPLVGAEYSFLDLISSISEGFYEMPTHVPLELNK
jgi:hypothetical protein